MSDLSGADRPPAADPAGAAPGEAATGYIAVTALSHPGAVRENHEDSLVAGPWTLCATVTDTPQTLVFPVGSPVVVAVADGLGGHPAGEVASALVVRELALAGPQLDGERAIRQALDACNRAVHEAASASPARATMGTTAAGVVITSGQALAFNVGDSRVYAAGPGGLRQLSTDDRETLPGLPGGLLTQTLGGTGELSPVDPHVAAVSLDPSVSYLVCTDGLTDPVPDKVLGKVLREHNGGRAVFELWKAAIEDGGPDNITMALVRLGG